MKAILCTSLIMIFTLSVSYGQIDYDKHRYQLKVAKFHKMKRTGTVLGVAGTAMTVAGVVLVSSAHWYTETNYYGQQNTTTDDPNGMLGLVAVIVGVPMVAGGVVLGIIGSKKEKEYQRKLDNISAGYYQRHGAHGLSIRIKI